MKQPLHISEVMHQLVLNNPNDPYAQILRRCPFMQADMLRKGYMSLDELSDKELDALVKYQFLEDWTDNIELSYKLKVSARTLQRWRSEGLVDSKYILELIEKEAPTHVAVVFDPPGGSFRNKAYAPYKANRPPTPQLVIDALEPLMNICQAMNMPTLMVPGYEADDVIGSLSRKFSAQGFKVYMVTLDKDYGQLVTDDILQYRPGKGNENEILGPKEICLKHGIDSTSQVIDMLAICGDSADNVPGIPGVGPVGAGKLLRKYHDIAGATKKSSTFPVELFFEILRFRSE